MDGEAGWWTTSKNIRLPPLARVMGRQQHIMHLMRGGNSVDMVYVDFAKAFEKVDMEYSSIKSILGISGRLGVWLYHSLTDRTHFVRLQGGVSLDSPVLSGVPQGTALGDFFLLF